MPPAAALHRPAQARRRHGHGRRADRPGLRYTHLRGLFDSPPYFHDGSAGTLDEALTRPSTGGEHDLRGLLSQAELQDLIAFLRALPFE